MDDNSKRMQEVLALEPEATRYLRYAYESPRGGVIKGAENRAITLKELKVLYNMIESRCEKEGWVNFEGNKLTPETVCLYDVCHYVILPVTMKRKCSFVEMLATSPRLPEWFISHWWGEPVGAFIKCLEAHAKDHNLTTDATYWICAYANNQWDLEGVNEHDLAKTPFYKAMKMANGTVSILDHTGVLFSRVWCGYELYLSLTGQNDDNFKWCVYTNTKNGAVGITEGNAPRDKSPGDKWRREQIFPVSSLEKSLDISIENAEASVEDDKARILKELGEDVDKLNASVIGRFAAAALRIELEKDGKEKKWLEFLSALERSEAKNLNLDFSYCEAFSETKRKQLKDNIPWDSLNKLSLTFNGNSWGSNICTNILNYWPFDKVEIVVLELDESNIGNNADVELFAGAIKSKTTLKHLSLRRNFICDNDMRHLCTILNEDSSLVSLNLSENAIGPSGAKEISDTLKLNASLKDLNLRENNLGDKGADVISVGVRENKGLELLDLSSNSIGDIGSKQISVMLKSNAKLKTLYLDDNQIKDDGMVAIAAGVKSNKTLLNLNLSGNIFGDKGGGAFAKSLKTNRSLQRLELGGNISDGAGISDVGAKQFADALKKNQSLLSLILRRNKIGDNGALNIADMLKKNKALQHLSLRYNKIGRLGAEAIIEALKVNAGLVTFDMGGNVDISGDLMKESYRLRRRH